MVKKVRRRLRLIASALPLLCLTTFLVLVYLSVRQERRQSELTLLALSAVFDHDPAALRSILDNGADASARWPENERGSGFSRFLRILGVNKERGADGNGQTLLITAIWQDRPDMMSLLIDKGADMEARTYGLSPLATAVIKGRPDMVLLLIDNGAHIGDDIKGLTVRILANSHNGDKAAYRLILSQLQHARGR